MGDDDLDLLHGGHYRGLIDDPSEPATLVATEDPLVFRFAHGELAGEQVRFLRNAAGAIAGVNVVGGPLRKLAPIER
jgi:hypothetical protein